MGNGIAQQFTWTGMEADVHRYCSACLFVLLKIEGRTQLAIKQLQTLLVPRQKMGF